MNIKKLLLLAVMPMMCLAVSAQDNTPQKGNFTVAATLGYNSYASVKALPSYQPVYEAAALSTNWADKNLMVGFEAGWFVSDLWKLSLGGGLNFTNNPGYGDVPGTVDGSNQWDSPESLMGEIPSYRAVGDASTFTYNVTAGIDRYFNVSGASNMMWYMGGRIGAAYGQNQIKYDEYTAMGKSVGDTFNFRVGFTMGIDYFVAKNMYVGAQIDPLSWTYNVTSYKPQDGMARLSADSHTWGLLSAPTVKIGFILGK